MRSKLDNDAQIIQFEILKMPQIMRFAYEIVHRLYFFKEENFTDYHSPSFVKVSEAYNLWN